MTERARWYDRIAYGLVMIGPSRWWFQRRLLPYAGRWAYREQGNG
jgi:hypothetical protein